MAWLPSKVAVGDGQDVRRRLDEAGLYRDACAQGQRARGGVVRDPAPGDGYVRASETIPAPKAWPPLAL